MAYRKFEVTYDRDKVQRTKEVPFSKEEWDKIMPSKKTPSPKLTPMPSRKPMQAASKPTQPKTQGGRTYAVAVKCLQERIFDHAEIEARVREAYIGSEHGENYIINSIVRAIRIVEENKK